MLSVCCALHEQPSSSADLRRSKSSSEARTCWPRAERVDPISFASARSLGARVCSAPRRRNKGNCFKATDWYHRIEGRRAQCASRVVAVDTIGRRRSKRWTRMTKAGLLSRAGSVQGDFFGRRDRWRRYTCPAGREMATRPLARLSAIRVRTLQRNLFLVSIVL